MGDDGVGLPEMTIFQQGPEGEGKATGTPRAQAEGNSKGCGLRTLPNLYEGKRGGQQGRMGREGVGEEK